MTNGDRIRQMSDEELAKFLAQVEAGNVDIFHGFCDVCGNVEKECWTCTLEWLTTEANYYEVRTMDFGN